MLLVFRRKILPDNKVEVYVTGTLGDKQVDIGKLQFPNKSIWSRFIGALQRGALQIPDLRIEIEGVQDAKAK